MYWGSNFFLKRVILCYICYIAITVGTVTYSSIYRAVAFLQVCLFLKN